MFKIQTVDLTDFCRPSSVVTQVSVLGYEKQLWLKLREFELWKSASRHLGKRWLFKAYLQNATDFEHDSAQIISMVLTGVEIDHVSYGTTEINGFIAAELESFRVPDPNYNPLTDKRTVKCKDCKGEDKHVIVPEGMYVPPPNEALYKELVGCPIEIKTGKDYRL